VKLRRHASSPDTPSEAPLIVHDVLRSPGQPLDAATRSFFEPRFGHDFSQVRVHTDARAAESARAVNALAYTVGRDVVFGAGEYSPKANAGRGLLAHELAHVIQQRNSEANSAPVAVSASHGLEVEADRAASAAVVSGHASVLHAAGPTLQKQDSPPAAAVGSGGAGPVAKGAAAAPTGGAALCSAHPSELYYKTNPSFCMDTPSSGSMHSGFRCYREIPKGSGCPSGQHVCFDSSGKCDAGQSHVDSTAPSITRDAAGMCDLSWLGWCSIVHGVLDVVPALLAEAGQAQADCVEICRKQPLLLQGFCMEGCAPMPF